MATDSTKKLTRYTSAVTVVTSEVMNSLFGGEYGVRTDLGEFDPLVAGHVHDGTHADGHSSKVLLTEGAHVRGQLAHQNLGGSNGTEPAVQAKNIQCYSEAVYGPKGGGNAIPEYIIDDAGNKCYYLDISVDVGGDDTQVQFNENGSLGGSPLFIYDYNQGRVGIGVPSPDAKLAIGSADNDKGIIVSEIEDSHVGPDVWLDKSRLGAIVQDQDLLGTIVARGWDGDSYEIGAMAQFRVDGTPSDNDMPTEFRIITRPPGVSSLGMNAHTRLIVKSDGKVGLKTLTPAFDLDVNGDSRISGSLTVNGDGFFDNDVTIAGKLNVGGLIDPTGLILTEEYASLVPTKDNEGAIFVAKDDGVLDKNKPYYKDELGNITPLGIGNFRDLKDIDALGANQGNIIQYEDASGKWVATSRVVPKVITWGSQSGSDIVISQSDKERFLIISGTWTSPGRVVVPSSPPEVGVEWQTGDSFWIKNLSLGTSETSYNTNYSTAYVGSNSFSSMNYIPIEVVGEGADTLDGESFLTPYYLPPKNAIRLCCIKNENSTSWFLMSHYHEIEYNRDPVITLLGEEEVSVIEGDTYEDQGATAYDFEDGDITSLIVTNNPVNSSVPGTYYVSYNVTDSDGVAARQVLRTVVVVANDAPVITLIGDRFVYVTEGDAYSDAGATASDTEDGDLTESIITSNPVNTAVPNTYIVTYNVTDSNGKAAAQVQREVTVEANAAPVITLIGESSVNLNRYDEYVELGATVTDDKDSDLEVVITGSVDTSTAGTYTLNYNATDNNGKAAAEVTRTIVVNDLPQIIILGDNPVTINVGDTYVDAGATASDTEDGDLTESIVTTNSVDSNTAGAYTVIYSVTDSDGASASTGRAVFVNALPVITLVGESEVVVNIGDSYEEQGATAFDAEDGTIEVSITGSVNTSAPGTYTLYYNAIDSDGAAAAQVTRTVVVNAAPVITLLGQNPMIIRQGDTYEEPGATVSDDRDEGLSAVITGSVNTAEPGTYFVTYNATDLDGASAIQVTRTVVVEVNTAPIISLIGPSTITINEGDTYVDSGATASDAEDGDLTDNIVTDNSVDASTWGTYTVTYNVSDSLGVAATEVVRTVIVNAIPVITVSPSFVTINEGDTYGEEEIRSGVTASDAEDGDLTTAITYSSNVNTAVPGDYTVIYNVTDPDEASAIPAIRAVEVVRANVGPQVSPIEQITTSPTVGGPIRFEAEVSDSDGTVVAYEWAFDVVEPGAVTTISPSGEQPASFESSFVDATVTVDTVGAYKLTLTATDDDGDTASASINFDVDNALPEASYTVSNNKDYFNGENPDNTFTSSSLSPIFGPFTSDSPAFPFSIGDGIIINAKSSSDPDGSLTAVDWIFKVVPQGSGYEQHLAVTNPAENYSFYSNYDDSNPIILYYEDAPGLRTRFAWKPDRPGYHELHMFLTDNAGDQTRVVIIFNVS